MFRFISLFIWSGLIVFRKITFVTFVKTHNYTGTWNSTVGKTGPHTSLESHSCFTALGDLTSASYRFSNFSSKIFNRDWENKNSPEPKEKREAT